MAHTAPLVTPTESIAIIGMAGRFPGARNLAEFWRNLCDGVESISFFSDRELEAAGVPSDLIHHPHYVKAGGVLDAIDEFDAAFFGMTPREAEFTDPQHRLFLECAWEALEDAGYDPATYPGWIGVFAGAGPNGYLLNNLYLHPAFRDYAGSLQAIVANDRDYLPTRVSYKLNLKGPSLNVQTACSTSLVAAHLACQSLLNGECDMALVGGVSVRVPHTAGFLFQDGGTISPDGYTRTFDAGGQGTIFTSGMGVVVLKRSTDAIEDRDHIYALIKGSAINNDGAVKVGFTAPGVDGQAAVIAMAQTVAGVYPESISYVEAHGTATPLGDPAEVAALTQVFRAQTEKKGFCAIGSVKTNIGHANAAAGAAGLIKAVLALQHKLIPPSLHFEAPNPGIDFANSPFFVNTTLRPWESTGEPRRAGVSSFGIGGTNAHAILEEAPPVEPDDASRPWQVLILSARTQPALERATANLAGHLKTHPETNLADAAYTLQVGRRAFDQRRIVVCRDVADAVTALETCDPQRVLTESQERRDRPVAFMFSGGGAQYVNMGLELYQAEPAFRREVDRCADLLQPRLGFDLRRALYPDEAQLEAAAAQLRQTIVALPALFTIEYALAKLWMSWGVRPQTMIGHSLGEYVAACLAEVFSLEDALALVAQRGRLMQDLPAGGMLSVSLPEAQARLLLGRQLSLAAVNAPRQCVVSGPAQAIAKLEGVLAGRRVEFRRVQIDVAAHSELVAPIVDDFARFVAGLRLQPPRLPYISNVTGEWITAAQATDPNYWARHLRQTVQFARGLQTLTAESDRVLLEVGPGQTLSRFAEASSGRAPLASLRHPRDQRSDVAFLLNTLGRLWLQGVPIDWSGFWSHERRQRVALPAYPFERQRYWIEPPQRPGDASIGQASSGRRPDLADWFYAPIWKQAHRPEPDAANAAQRWLVFLDACDLGAQLANRLKAAGGYVAMVAIGERSFRPDEDTYTIDPRRPGDYDALFETLQAQDKTPHHIIHAWSVTPDAEVTDEFLEECQALGFYSLLFLAQAIGRRTTGDVRISILSNGVQCVTGDEALQPEKATLLGPCKTIPQEYEHVACRSIDVALPDAGTPQRRKLIEQLSAELLSLAPEAVIAYRGRQRWVQAFEPVRVAPVDAGSRLRERGVYLITGGLGGIGLALAEHLAQRTRARLILVGRSAFPERAEWESRLATQSTSDGIADTIRKLQAIESLGAEVHVFRADVTDEAQMRQVVADAHERLGAIHGVIHAAGVLGTGVIQLKTAGDAASVLAPKVRGARMLERVLKDEPLDFFLLCSSTTAITGSVGRADYCAANAFLDAFAHERRAREAPFTLSINWDLWRETGMAARLAKSSEKADRLLIAFDKGIASEEGVEVFQRALSARHLAQLVVSVVDMSSRVEEAKRARFETLRQESVPLHPRPALQTAYAAPRDEAERILAGIWQELLGVERVGVHDNFFELGGDSVIAIQIISKANQAGLPLSTSQLFDCQTIAELATRVSGPQSTAQFMPLSPMQRWLVEHLPSDAGEAAWIEAQGALAPELLERAVPHLLSHHAALRLRLVTRDGESIWQPFNASDAPFAHIDLSALTDAAQDSACESAPARLQAGLDPADGRLLQVALFDLGPQRASRLLIVIHTLAIDSASWRIVLDDLHTAYRQLRDGEPAQLPAATASFEQWIERLQARARSDSMEAEAAHWLAESSASAVRLPRDFADGANVGSSTRNVSIDLDAGETHALLHIVPGVYHADVTVALLAALVEAMARWTGERALRLALEDDGRDAAIDLSRSVGQFIVRYPLALNLIGITDPGEGLKAVKEQLRLAPGAGLSHGILRYLREADEIARQLKIASEPEIGFTYLGEFESAPPHSAFQLMHPPHRPAHAWAGDRPYLLEVSSYVAHDRLQVDWRYSANVHRRETIERLAHDFIESLRALIAHCQSPEAGGFTPSDFPQAGLDQSTLDRFLDRFRPASGKGSA